MTTVLIVPGLNSSGTGHWQTWFEEQLPGTVRVIQSDWAKPDLKSWSARIRRDLSRNPGRHILVGHSFGVLASVHAAVRDHDRIAGALLVAPADPDKFGVADELPQHPLPFPSAVVASSNDPWMTLWKAAEWADRWGADFVNLGDAGHINTEAGFGPWSEGLALLERLRRRSEHITDQRTRGVAGEYRPRSWRRELNASTVGPRVRRAQMPSSRLGAG